MFYNIISEFSQKGDEADHVGQQKRFLYQPYGLIYVFVEVVKN